MLTGRKKNKQGYKRACILHPLCFAWLFLVSHPKLTATNTHPNLALSGSDQAHDHHHRCSLSVCRIRGPRSGPSRARSVPHGCGVACGWCGGAASTLLAAPRCLLRSLLCRLPVGLIRARRARIGATVYVRLVELVSCWCENAGAGAAAPDGEAARLALQQAAWQRWWRLRLATRVAIRGAVGDPDAVVFAVAAP